MRSEAVETSLLSLFPYVAVPITRVLAFMRRPHEYRRFPVSDLHLSWVGIWWEYWWRGTHPHCPPMFILVVTPEEGFCVLNKKHSIVMISDFQLSGHHTLQQYQISVFCLFVKCPNNSDSTVNKGDPGVFLKMFLPHSGTQWAKL